jgi:hypothetical protein
MKVEKDAILTCSVCGFEGAHELLYLSGHLCASRCVNCGARRVYIDDLYSEYARDVAERTSRLPGRFVGDLRRRPFELAWWPYKIARKPFGLAREVGQISAFAGTRSRAKFGRRA